MNQEIEEGDRMDLIKKVFSFEVKQIGLENERTLSFTGSTEDIDRDGDVIEAYGWDLKDYQKNPVIMGFHEYDKFPYGKSIKTYIDYQSKQLKFEVKFPTISELTSFPGNADMIAEHAKLVDMAYNMYKNSYMNSVSVGFIGLEAEPMYDEKGNFKGKRYKKQSLLELSLVPVPSQPNALMEARSKGFINDNELKMFEEAKDVIIKPGWDETGTSFRFRVRDPGLFQDGSFRTVPIKQDKPRVNSVMGKLQGEDTMKIQSLIFPKEDGWDLSEAKTWLSKHEDLKKGVETMEQKGAIPYHKYPLADEGTSWNGPAEIAAASVDDLKLMCAWYDSENAENKGAYKLPHHTQSNKSTVWRAVAAAMGALLGARGGVQIPESDRRGVYNHLAKHYADFEKEPPEYKSYTDIELKSIFGEKSGASLSSKNKEILESIHKDMKECHSSLKACGDKLRKFMDDNMPMEPPDDMPMDTADMTMPMMGPMMMGPMMEPMMSAMRTAIAQEVKQALEEIKSQVLLLSQKDANKVEIDLDAIEFPKAEKDAAHNELDIKPEELKQLITEIINNQIKGGN